MHDGFRIMARRAEILEGARRLVGDAKSAGVVLCPGVGFDVTPTDCIALMLKTALPDAHELALRFEADSRMSPCTATTAIEALGKSGTIWRNGRIVDLKTIVGIAPPARGTIALAAEQLAGRPSAEITRRGISYVPQGRGLFAGMSVAQNMELGRLRRRNGAGRPFAGARSLTQS
jgi:hypothetical protein